MNRPLQPFEFAEVQIVFFPACLSQQPDCGPCPVAVAVGTESGVAVLVGVTQCPECLVSHSAPGTNVPPPAAQAFGASDWHVDPWNPSQQPEAGPGVSVAVALAVPVLVGVSVGVGVIVSVSVAVDVAVEVLVPVGVGVLVGHSPPPRQMISGVSRTPNRCRLWAAEVVFPDGASCSSSAMA